MKRETHTDHIYIEGLHKPIMCGRPASEEPPNHAVYFETLTPVNFTMALLSILDPKALRKGRISSIQ